MTEQKADAMQDQFIDELFIDETNYLSEQFIPSRDLSPIELSNLEQDQILDLRRRRQLGLMWTNILETVPETFVYFPVIEPDKVKNADFTDVIQKIHQEQEIEFADRIRGRQMDFSSTYVNPISRVIQGSKYVLLLDPKQAIPHANSERNKALADFCQYSLDHKNWLFFLNSAAGLRYANPDNPHILEEHGISLDQLWSEIRLYAENVILPGFYDNPQQDYLGPTRLQALESMQVLFPGEINTLSGFTKLIDHVKKALTETQGASQKAYTAYYLAIFTSGGLEVSTKGIDILPSTAIRLASRVAEPPQEFA